MSRNRDKLGRFVKQQIEILENSPKSSSSPRSHSPPSPILPALPMMVQQQEVQPRTLQDYLHPTHTATPSCIMYPMNMPNFDFKPGMIQLLPTFHGMENESPYVHIQAFEEVVATFNNQADIINLVRLKFFPFSLKEKAKSWLYSLRPRSIGTWEEMTKVFFSKFFPPHKTSNLKRQISTFNQKDHETFHQVWERFKDLMGQCPHHGYESWRLVSYFYDGLTADKRQFVQMMCNGDFLQKDPEEALEYLEEISEKSYTWSAPSPTEKPRTAGVYQLKEEDSVKAQLEALKKQFEAFKTQEGKALQMVAKVEKQEPCFICGATDHQPQECPNLSMLRGGDEEQCNALGDYKKPYNAYSNTYNPGWRNHPNFSWKDTSQNQASESQWKPDQQNNSLENSMKILADSQLEFRTYFAQVIEELKDIKIQLTKLNDSSAIQERGKLPAQPLITPKGQHMAQTSTSSESNLKEVNAITTRSGQSTVSPLPKTTSVPMPAPDAKMPQNPPVKVPFPQALKSTKKVLENHGEILDNLKQVKINLPLLHVIKQVPAYAKVIKDLCTMKRKHHVKKTAFLTEQLSAVIEQKIPIKYKDPSCPTIACQIGTQGFGQALLDLGASVNLMPYSIYLQLGLVEMKPTSVVLQMADRSIKKPRGIVEDVLIKVGKFYYPADFLILDTQSEVNTESKIPIILGRPFLATANALINCRNGLMKLSFGNMTMEVNIFHVAKQPPNEEEDCYHTDVIDTIIEEEILLHDDSDSLNDLLHDFDIENMLYPPEEANVSSILEMSQDEASPSQYENLRFQTRSMQRFFGSMCVIEKFL
ncbi:uncharacterized protein LOC133030544 [Cannabis sativa]|uniref:uncharacterized protein LOC133030544 n=1 Tax=Cannabis sativa TaxID=3483 RepID=UPI0029CA3C6B|nr:uncharacterized protein LOC133030544 [Cannabis sativa]